MTTNKVKPVWTEAKKTKLVENLSAGISGTPEGFRGVNLSNDKKIAAAILNGLGLESSFYSSREGYNIRNLVRQPNRLFDEMQKADYTFADVTTVAQRLFTALESVGSEDGKDTGKLKNEVQAALTNAEQAYQGDKPTTESAEQGAGQADESEGQGDSQGQGPGGFQAPEDTYPAFFTHDGFMDREGAWGVFLNTVMEIAGKGDEQLLEIVSESFKAFEARLLDGSTLVSKSELTEKIDEVLKLVEISKGFTLEIDTKSHEIPQGLRHKMFPEVLKYVAAKIPVLLVGPAGGGKTTLCQQVFDALELDFHFQGAADSPYKLLGFRDAQGRYQDTPFRRAFENGGGFLLDEYDASNPTAVVTAINTALTHDIADFPDGPVKRHENFYFMAAANTFGRGADRQYVGRFPQDAAALDRFAILIIDYDETLERAAAGNDDWVKVVQNHRRATYKAGVRHVVSPRASIQGAQALKAGVEEKQVIESVIWRGIDRDSRERIENHL